MPLYENWTRTTMSTPETGIGDLSKFLESDTFHEYCVSHHRQHPHHAPCVYDIIELWFVAGNGKHLCPTFESLRMMIFAIVDELLLIGTVMDVEIWPKAYLDAEGKPQEVLLYAHKPEEPTSIFKAYQHPIMDRTNFDITQGVAALERRS